MSVQTEQPLFQKERRKKAIAFIISETVALGVMIPVGIFAVSRRLTDPTLALSVNIVTLAAAAAVAIIPIVFFALAPTLPRE